MRATNASLSSRSSPSMSRGPTSRRSPPSLLFVIFFPFAIKALKKMPGTVMARQVIVRSRSGDDFLRLRLFAQEAQQFGVDILCMRPSDAVRPALHNVQASALDHFRGTGA